jgi:polycomb protein EED
VFRTNINHGAPLELIRAWRSDVVDTALDVAYQLNSICWTKDANGNPLICAAGASPKSILIYSVEENALIRKLAGHGKPINDLKISPESTNILASASEDHTIRIWNLSDDHESQPCVAILFGQGHKQPLLTIDFHPNGRWLLSGAMDTAVALWAIPPLSELHQRKAQDQEPMMISYPCFFSEEVHADYVDSIKWYGDAIISRASRGQNHKGTRNDIVLWQISGFESSAEPPAKPAVPYPGLQTRSAFLHTGKGFQRLLTFAANDTSRFYFRFGLLHLPNMRPILAMVNEKSKFLFWDLQKCEEGEDANEIPRTSRSVRGARGKGRGGLNAESLERRLGGIGREPSVVSSDGTSGTSRTNSRFTTYAMY